jgi:hypothetical protein
MQIFRNAVVPLHLTSQIHLNFPLLSLLATSFRSPISLRKNPVKNGARSMTAIMDAFAGIALAAQLNSASYSPSQFMTRSMPLSVVETKQGMYKEYTVDKVDDSALDEIRRGYKTAEETDEGKTKVPLIYNFIIQFAKF